MKDGINFTITHENVALLEDTTENHRTMSAHRVRLDISVYKRMLEQALRENAEFLIAQENYNDKVQAGVERVVELAVKATKGHITKLVEDEVARLVRERVASMVQGLPMSVQVSIGSHNEANHLPTKEAKDGQATDG
jgi:hypothetical protein